MMNSDTSTTASLLPYEIVAQILKWCCPNDRLTLGLVSHSFYSGYKLLPFLKARNLFQLIMDGNIPKNVRYCRSDDMKVFNLFHQCYYSYEYNRRQLLYGSGVQLYQYLILLMMAVEIWPEISIIPHGTYSTITTGPYYDLSYEALFEDVQRVLTYGNDPTRTFLHAPPAVIAFILPESSYKSHFEATMTFSNIHSAYYFLKTGYESPIPPDDMYESPSSLDDCFVKYPESTIALIFYPPEKGKNQHYMDTYIDLYRERFPFPLMDRNYAHKDDRRKTLQSVVCQALSVQHIDLYAFQNHLICLSLLISLPNEMERFLMTTRNLTCSCDTPMGYFYKVTMARCGHYGYSQTLEILERDPRCAIFLKEVPSEIKLPPYLY